MVFRPKQRLSGGRFVRNEWQVKRAKKTGGKGKPEEEPKKKNVGF